ncbi:hypothetical protein TRFO_39364 [Tritrichomonas foetus]|uniref:NrS-1 polymerase-like helicase domain-containing protein n=1 Tax=Tritrichomonas foetus TaxID=1144522 RepID=A0A1J4J9W3_9EUKA|nr:hypothetical protein TRFO_39364 [Tritrichomonas foetus]|eukprot:OHS94435.1 hypothetical protein TRFO_39364 [Tritrichomonas foetus]
MREKVYTINDVKEVLKDLKRVMGFIDGDMLYFIKIYDPIKELYTIKYKTEPEMFKLLNSINLWRRNGFENKNFVTVLDVYKKYGNSSIAYRGVLFQSDNPKVLSIFGGFDVNPSKNPNFELLEKFFWHVRCIVCNNNEELFEYTINWFSWIVQNPGKKIGTALVLRGRQGIGKNAFFTDVLCKWIGRYAYDNITTIEELTGQFNSCLENSMLIVLNEMMNFVEGRNSNFDVLKSIITDPIIRINEKNLPRRTAQNVSNFIFCSNNVIPVKITEGDRRYVAYDVSDRMKCAFQYFNELAKCFTPEFYSNLLGFFLQQDLSEFNPRVIPMTEAKKAMMEATVSSVKLFLADNFFDFSKRGVPPSESWSMYVQWAYNNHSYKVTRSTFSAEMSMMCEIKRHHSRPRFYVIKPAHIHDIEALQKERINDQECEDSDILDAAILEEAVI